MADFRAFLELGTFPERKALIRNFVQGIEVVGDEATLTYTIPMPSDGRTREGASVLDFVQSGPPKRTRTISGPRTSCPYRPSMPWLPRCRGGSCVFQARGSGGDLSSFTREYVEKDCACGGHTFTDQSAIDPSLASAILELSDVILLIHLCPLIITPHVGGTWFRYSQVESSPVFG